MEHNHFRDLWPGHDRPLELLMGSTGGHGLHRVPFPMCYGTQFTTPGNTHSAAGEIKLAMAAGEVFRAHAFEYACAKADIDHRLTKPNHPWTNGQVERMNRTIKEATVRRYFYDSHDRLREHLDLFLRAYNFAKRLKSLKGLTPYEHICKTWTEQPKRFRLDPIHHMPGLNS